MSNTIWLTGSRGYVGRYVKQSLIDLKINVRSVSNSNTCDKAVTKVDFSDKQSIIAAVDKYGVPDTFIHLGWGNVYDPHHECHLGSNLREGINLIDQLYDCGVKRFLLIGSSSEYGDRTGSLLENYPASGEVNDYVKGKRALAKYGLKAAKSANKIFIHIRLFYVYGAGQQHNSLINQLFSCATTEKDMNLSPCDQFRDYIYVTDAAEGIIRIASVNRSGIVNLGSGTPIQLKEFVKLLWKELEVTPDRLIFGAHDQPEFEQSQPKAFANIDKLIKLTNWAPSTLIENGIKMTIKQMRLSHKI